MKISDSARHIIILVMLSLAFFMFGNSLLSLTNPDEVFYAQTAKEMAQHNTWMVPYLFDGPQFEKPVLTYWLIRLGYIIFGVTNFGARFFPALFGLIGALAVYFFSRAAFKEEKKAFFCALVMMSAGLYIGLARTVFTDLIFSVFIFLSLGSFFWAYINNKRKAAGLVLFFVFSGLAVLTKGPLGFLIPVLVGILFLAIRKELKFIISRFTLWGLACFILIALPWYVYIIKIYGREFIQEFFYNDHIRRLFEAEHSSNDTWYFYPLSALGCMFPWSIFTAAGLVLLFKKVRTSNPVYLYLACWIAVVFVVFQAAHSKLVSYILPMFAAMAVVTGDFIYEAVAGKKRFIRWFFFINCLIFLFSAAGLFVASSIYSKFVPSRTPVYVLVLLLTVLILWMLNFIRRKELFKAAFLSMFPLVVILYFALIMHLNYEAYVSSKMASSYLLKNHSVENTLLVSKFFARGVRYFTDKKVAIINIRGGDFFSPHPAPYFKTDESAIAFLRTQDITYGVLRKSAIEDLVRIIDKEFTLEILKTIGDENVVRIKKL